VCVCQCVCECVRARVCARARARVCACVRVCVCVRACGRARVRMRARVCGHTNRRRLCVQCRVAARSQAHASAAASRYQPAHGGPHTWHARAQATSRARTHAWVHAQHNAHAYAHLADEDSGDGNPERLQLLEQLQHESTTGNGYHVDLRARCRGACAAGGAEWQELSSGEAAPACGHGPRGAPLSVQPLFRCTPAAAACHGTPASAVACAASCDRFVQRRHACARSLCAYSQRAAPCRSQRVASCWCRCLVRRTGPDVQALVAVSQRRSPRRRHAVCREDHDETGCGDARQTREEQNRLRTFRPFGACCHLRSVPSIGSTTRLLVRRVDRRVSGAPSMAHRASFFYVSELLEQLPRSRSARPARAGDQLPINPPTPATTRHTPHGSPAARRQVHPRRLCAEPRALAAPRLRRRRRTRLRRQPKHRTVCGGLVGRFTPARVRPLLVHTHIHTPAHTDAHSAHRHSHAWRARRVAHSSELLEQLESFGITVSAILISEVHACVCVMLCLTRLPGKCPNVACNVVTRL
jgi:hypothetical protein